MPEPQSPLAATNPAPSPWWRIADFIVFGLWLTLVSVIEAHHEPWADEAIAWLIARDLSLKKIWFHELRYEGSPGLWHTILWIAQHWFHAPYPALGLIGVLCAAAGVAFILWKAPFPRPLSYLLVFSYFISYQYAVVARSYVLLPLFLFAAAFLYQDRSRPVRMTAVLILLANVSLHGALLAGSFGLCYLMDAFKDWPTLSEKVRRNYAYCIAAVVFTFLFLFIILKPTPDVGEFTPQVRQMMQPGFLKFELLVAYAFFDQLYLSALFLLLAAAWCFMRRKFLLFALPVSLLTLLFVLVHGRPHHTGTVFLAAIAALWVAWPTQSEMQGFSYTEHMTTYGITGLLVCLFCLNIWDAAVTMQNDYRYPYSGSKDAANFLKRVGADKTTIFGYTYGMSAVQAYFDHNILANIPTSYYQAGLPLYGAVMNLSELQAAAPQYVVVYGNDGSANILNAVDLPLRQMGYARVHFSDGHVFYKRLAVDTDIYYVYRREFRLQDGDLQVR